MEIIISKIRKLPASQKPITINENGKEILYNYYKVYEFFSFSNDSDEYYFHIGDVKVRCTESGEELRTDAFNRKYEKLKKQTLDFEQEIKEQKEADEKTEENKYFSKENLKDALGDQGMKQLEAVEIKPGEAFLNGENTNITFADKEDITNNTSSTTFNDTLSNYKSDIDVGGILSTDPMSGILNTTMNLSSRLGNDIASSTAVSTLSKGVAVGIGTTQMVTDLAQNAPDIIISLSQAIIGNITSTITGEMTRITTDYIGRHTTAISSFPSQIMSYAMSYFNANKISISDVLKTLNDSLEERSKTENDNNNEKNKSNFLKNIQKDSKEFVSKINKYVDIGTSYIGMITSYIQNGPDWVVEQANKQIGSFVDLVNTEVDKQWEKDKKKYDDRARTYGNKVGAEMVERYNNQVKKTQKKALEKIEKMKTKNLTKLFANKAKGASKLASITGIYIPV